MIMPRDIDKPIDEPRVDIEKVKQFVVSRWTLDSIHGVSHWDRVYCFGQQLLTPECNALVVGLFAYLHDSCRESNGYDEEHGPRAAQWIETLRDNLLKGLSDDEFHLLQEAIRLHTVCHRTGNATIDACFDSDRLDLGRVGITPNPKKMASQKGVYLANKMMQNKKLNG